MICHHCNENIRVEAHVSRRDECPACGMDLHSCINCTNYDLTASNRCREPQSEWIPDREKGNFCDFFSPNKVKSVAQRNTADLARSAFDELFKK